MSLHRLDTKITNHITKGDNARVRTHLATLPMASVVLSAVSNAELQELPSEAVDTILVTRDKTFALVTGSQRIENWTVE